MSNQTNEVPTRSIVCVDGTWFAPDGAHGNRDKNITNVSRLYTSIGHGTFQGSSGTKQYNQTKKYFEGIGAGDALPFGERLSAGLFGKPCLDQIREVYEHCCVTAGPHDELWLFGFSRGAFVVRAVAGLLHYMGALKSAGQASFKSDFKLALEVYKKMQQQQKLGEGQIHHMLEVNTRPAATIQFVGVFDTVKAVQDERLYNISFNSSIQHLRHALALNEDRQRFRPEYIFPDFHNRTQNLKTRSFVQAWFVGGHIDMGGSCHKDGLSLYPLQWMLIESQAHGLALRFDGTFGGRSTLVSPLQITGLEGETEPWSCTSGNGIGVEMRDIRDIHGAPKHNGRYAIHLNRSRGHLWIRTSREPFGDNQELNGYCSFGSQGTIVHPSVYLILDKFMHISLEAKHFPFYQALQRWRPNVLGPKDDTLRGCFWNDSHDHVQHESPGAVRILVCGNTGVGKSSLINLVFGVPKTTVSHVLSGSHQIDDELLADEKPELIIHDSNGFESGGKDELLRVQDFLRKRSTEVDVDKRLHIIWYCFELNTSRPHQAAQSELFRSLSQYAQDVPIVVIATKKDEFFDIKQGQHLRDLKSRGESASPEAVDTYLAEALQERLRQIGDGLSETARFDAIVSISEEDIDSISQLSLITSQLFTHDRFRLLYIRAQGVRLDLKMNLALAETIKIYKSTWISSSTVSGIPLALTTNRGAAAIDICRAVVLSFGMPKIPAEVVWQIIKTNLWDDMRNSARIFIAEVIAATGMTVTVLSGGLPFFLISMAVNPPMAIVTTSRLMVMLSCDIISILTRAFREAMVKSISKPEKADIEAAAVAYQAHCHEVHSRVKSKLSNVWKCSQKGKIESWMIEIIEEFKYKVLEGVGASLPPDFKRGYNDHVAAPTSTSGGNGSSSSTVYDWKIEC